MSTTNINLSGRILSTLIDFNFLVDTDIGLIRFIREKFQDNRAFKLDELNKSDRSILSLLYSRTNWNPLSIISTEKNLPDIDELYNSFFETYKKDILYRSLTYTKINTFITMLFDKANVIGVNPGIYVKDDLEAEEITRFFGINKLIETEEKRTLSSREVYYVKDYKFFTNHELTDIVQKKIYISPRAYNALYIRDNVNNLTMYNEFIPIGTNYSRKEEENKNGKSSSSSTEGIS